MFYISSQGHSATGWLATVLSMHPQIVCWHGTRSIPPYQSGKNDIPAKEFVEGLVKCEEGCFGQKVFGACHGYYGIRLKSFVEENNGIFLGIVRNPIKRINSIFLAFAGPQLTYGLLPTDTKIDIYALIDKHKKLIDTTFPSLVSKERKGSEKIKRIKNTLDSAHILNLLKRWHILKCYTGINRTIKRRAIAKKRSDISKKATNPLETISILAEHELVKNIVQNFISACKRTFVLDSEIFDACDIDCLIKMEEMTRSPEYFNNSIFYKIMNAKADESYLRKVFDQQDHVNIHSNIIKNPTEIFKSWPKSFQDYFLESLYSCSAKELYDNFKYDVPTDLWHI
jgi:hypothetical protein